VEKLVEKLIGVEVPGHNGQGSGITANNTDLHLLAALIANQSHSQDAALRKRDDTTVLLLNTGSFLCFAGEGGRQSSCLAKYSKPFC